MSRRAPREVTIVNGLSALLCGGSLVAVGGLVATEPPFPTAESVTPTVVPDKAPFQARVWSEQDFKFVWNKPLQLAVAEPAQAPRSPALLAVPAAPPLPPLKAQLVATFLDGPYARALVQMAPDTTKLIRVGEVLEVLQGHPATVESIERTRLTVKVREDVRTLRLPASLPPELSGSTP